MKTIWAGDPLKMADEIVRASEIGQYSYCARAWWLNRVKGYQPTNQAALDSGTALHLSHGRAVQTYARWRRWAYLLLALAIVVGLVFILRLLAVI